MSEPESLLTARGVSRRFGYRYVIKSATLEVRRGQTLLLVGHNGAGKTTLLKVLAGSLGASEGTVERCDSVGVVAHDSMLYDSLTATENLRFYGRLYCRGGRRQTADLLEMVGLGEHANRRVATYSRGMVQRLALARALLPDPELLLLDEPFTGLDESASTVVRQVIARQRSRDRAVVLATHQIADVVDLASDVGFLSAGRLLECEPVNGRDSLKIVDRYRELLQNV